MNKLLLIAPSLFLLIEGCKEAKNNNLMPELATCDSAAIMYYNEPGKPKFFNMAKLYDKESITALSENVNGKLIKGKDSCITEGKIYGYGKGDAVYVVYFNKSENCMILSFIKTGEKYFTHINKATQGILNDLQKTANETANEK
jgi:hypothetical protein